MQVLTRTTMSAHMEEEPQPAPGVGTIELVEEFVEEALPYFVILYDDDFHTLDQVIHQVQKATGLPAAEAFEVTMQAHTNGKTVCYSGDHEECEKVANILREIKLTAEVDHYAGA